MEHIEKMARGIRLAITKQQYNIGNLTREEAIDILSGPLTPGDESTTRDDSHLLDASLEEIYKALEFI